jgi:hypothetical protein
LKDVHILLDQDYNLVEEDDEQPFSNHALLDSPMPFDDSFSSCVSQQLDGV